MQAAAALQPHLASALVCLLAMQAAATVASTPAPPLV
jgi:hypothetical protein